MSAAVIVNDTVFSTPRHDNHSNNSNNNSDDENNDDSMLFVPSTPNKKTKSFELHWDESLMTPSKSFRSEKKSNPLRKYTNIVNTTPQTHNINKNYNNISNISGTVRKTPILSPIPTDSRMSSLMIDSFDGVLSEKLNRDLEIYSPLSDLEVISPLSDISSCSPCIEMKKPMDFNSIPSLPWNPNGRLSLYQRDDCSSRQQQQQQNHHASQIIPSTLIDLQKRMTSEEDKMFVLDLPPLGKNNTHHTKEKQYISTPLHRTKTPSKPVIRNDSKSLNLIVSSGNGSLDDATIYATEINASSMHADSSNGGEREPHGTIPTIKNVWERITIPVNHEIKERHKRLRSSYFGEFYNLDESLSSSPQQQQEDDYALIRGYEFEIDSTKATDGTNSKTNHVNKKVRWNIPLP